MTSFNFFLNGKIEIEGGDKGEPISENCRLHDKLVALEQDNEALSLRLSASKELIYRMNKYLSTRPESWSEEERIERGMLTEKAFQFLKEVEE